MTAPPRLRDQPLALIGCCVIVIITLAALFAPLLAQYEPSAIDTGPPGQGPTTEHWFGTDQLGRDVFSQVLYGARVSLRVGLAATLLAVVIGVIVGAVAGWYGRWVDSLLMRATDALLAIPYLVLALAVVAALGRGEGTVTLVLGLFSWMPIARVVRATILQERELPYVKAARAMGFSERRILVRHVLPSTAPTVVVLASLGIGALILTEATLSYLGAGATRSWGRMLNDARNYFEHDPHLLLFPGGALLVTVIAFVLIGDALRVWADPTARRSR